MVVLSEVSNMFWGVTLDGGKHYTQTVERSFHISMAALEPSAASNGKLSKQPVSVMIQHDKAEFMLCTLEQGRVYQQTLDLNFTEGEEVTFFLNGTGIVHLTGYLVEDENMMSDLEDMDDADLSMEDMSDSDSDTAPALVDPDDSEDSDDDEDESPAITVSNKKRKQEQKEKPGKKKAKVVVVEEEEDDDDDDEDMSLILSAADLGDDDDDDDDDYEDADDDDDDDDELNDEIEKQITAKKVKPVSTPKSGKKSAVNTPKSEVKATPQQKKEQTQNGSETTESTKKKKKKKNKEKKDDKEKTPGPGGDAKKVKTPKKAVLAGGTISEEIKVGHGLEAKRGKMAHVYYKGTLAKNGKQFDSCTGGKPFRFRLGKKEVISGWDNGVVGMKVGGTRKLTVPPQQAYGNQRTGPIPPNSTLVFEVELKAVS
ncbi:46 kDa FK506-binding nuclear protein-like isoform X1 [Mizuhopecten yessoensis]|uniref:46 kDa FK506-binding nuclear protein-like isoform X1 n=1 Tax=Mizuhopecten yessoensis TaxID=6573 RepID=UPI000B45DDD6|nr:46 kDa FK506-binding nuclear protein-like isoform X1 [Mizuhopecten yessoensis]